MKAFEFHRRIAACCARVIGSSGVIPDDGIPQAAELDFEAAYRQADLEQDWWSVVGPATLDEFRTLGRGKLEQLRVVGLQADWCILDIGCGTGQLAEPLSTVLSPRGRYVGTDIAQEAVDFCRTRFSAANFEFHRNDATSQPLPEGAFDVVYLGSVFTHLYPAEIGAVLAGIHKVLAPDGRVVVDAFVSPSIAGFMGDRSMTQLNEPDLQASFEGQGFSWHELGSAVWTGDSRRVVYFLQSAVPQEMPAPLREAVLVLGMHRSGTSMVSRLLSSMGASGPLGEAPGVPDHAEGYGEPPAVVAAMERLLSEADSAWFDYRPLSLAKLTDERLRHHHDEIRLAIRQSFAAVRCFVLKDPRLSRAVGFVRDVLSDMAVTTTVVLCVRSPQAVADSLRVRDQISLGYAALCWARHMLDAEHATRDMPRVVIDYDKALQAPAEMVDALAAVLPWAMRPTSVQLAALIQSPGRRHLADGLDTRLPGLATIIQPLAAAFARLALCDDDANREAVDDAAVPVYEAMRQLEPALIAEFAILRLTGRHMQPDIARPADDAKIIASSFEDLQTFGLQ